MQNPGWSLCPLWPGPKGLGRTTGAPSIGLVKLKWGRRDREYTRPLPLKSLCLLFLQSPQGRHGAQEVALALPLTQLQVGHFTSWCLSFHICRMGALSHPPQQVVSTEAVWRETSVVPRHGRRAGFSCCQGEPSVAASSLAGQGGSRLHHPAPAGHWDEGNVGLRWEQN